MWERRERREQHWLSWGWPSLSQTLASVLHWDVRAICEWMWERRERREQHWLYEAGLLSLKLLCLFSTEMLEQYVSGCEREEREESSTDCMRLAFSLSNALCLFSTEMLEQYVSGCEREEREESSTDCMRLAFSLSNSSLSLHSHIAQFSALQWVLLSSLSSVCSSTQILSNMWVDVREKREKRAALTVWGWPSLSQTPCVCSPLRC